MSIYDAIGIAIIGFCLGVAIGCVVGMQRGKQILQDGAIEHNVGYYHPETAEFTWKVENNASNE